MIFEQYDKTKELYPDHILLMRVGDCMEAFGDDARTVSETCDIVLTKSPIQDRWCAGFPYFSTELYVGKLIKAGHKVALAEPVKERS